MADWSEAQYRAWLVEAGTAYRDAMLFDVSEALLFRMGGVFALAGQDRNRLFHFWTWDSTKQQLTTDAWQAHRAAIERSRQRHGSIVKGIEAYITAQTSSWPQTTDELRAANAPTAATLPYSTRLPRWFADLVRMRAALARQPTALASALTVVGYAVSSEGDWNAWLRHAMEFDEKLKGPKEFLGALAKTAGSKVRAGSAQPDRPVAAEVRPLRPARAADPKATSSRSTTVTREPLSRRSSITERPKSTDRGLGPPGAKPTRTETRPARPVPASGPVNDPLPAAVLGARATPSRAAPAAGGLPAIPPVLRAEFERVLRNDPAAVAATWQLFAKYPKLSRDAVTGARVAELYRVTRQFLTAAGKNRTFVENRAAAGELRAIVKMAQSERILEVRLLAPEQAAGSRTPDSVARVLLKGQADLRVEITTVTGAARGARTRPHTPAGSPEMTGGKPDTVDRPSTAQSVVDAVRRKLERGQAPGGIIVVNVPYGTTPPLTRADVARIDTLWRTHRKGQGTVREIWVVLPDPKGEPTRVRFLAGEGLGLTVPLNPTR